MASRIICCKDMQLPSFSSNANACEIADFVVWARTAPKQKLSMCLPIGISKTKCYFQVTVHPGFPKNPSTRTFMVQEDDNKPYQEVLSAASIKSGYEQVASISSCLCPHGKYMTVDFFREHFTSKPRNPLRSAATEDKFAWPPLHSWGENVGPYYFPSVVEKKDDRLLRPSFSRPFGKESKPPLFILEKRDRDQRQRRKYPSSKHKQKNVLLLSSLEPPCDDVRPPKGFTSPGLAVKATPSSSVTAKKVDDLWPMKSPAIRSPAKETDPPSVFALEKETPGEQRKARTSPKCEKKTDPVSSALENRHDQWLKRPTSPVWTTAAIPSSTDSEKPDDDIWCGKPVWYSRGSKASPNSVFTEKENICQARSEITTVIPPGIIETAIKQLKIVEAQVKKTSLFTDAALAEAVVAGAISVDETGVDTAVEDTTEVNDIFYMPLEQPLLPTESEIEGLPDLELEDFGYWYPKRASHAYRDYGEDGWVEVLPWKEWKDPENYPCEI